MYYKWRNQCFVTEIPTSKSKQISHTARLLIQRRFLPESRAFWNSLNVCFWYCFSFDESQPIQYLLEFRFLLSGSLSVDFSMSSGIFRIDQQLSRYLLMNDV